MKTATPRRPGSARGGGGGFALLGWVVHHLGHLPRAPKNSLVAIIELPYVLVRVVIFLAVVVPVLAATVVWLLIRLVFTLPRAVVATVAVKTSLTAGSRVDGSGRAGKGSGFDVSSMESPARQPGAECQRQLALMAGGDVDAFTAGVFDRAAALWRLWQESVVTYDADALRPAMTEGCWRVHRMVQDLRASNNVERVFDGRVVNSAIVQATHSGIVDEVRVRLGCGGICYDRSVDPELVLRGSADPGRWSEEVTLRRSAVVRDLAAGGLSPMDCPNCGAPLDVSPEGACRTCQALVAGRPSDWVLDDGWREQW